MSKKLPPIHPGEQLREEFMIPLGLSSNALARALNVTPARINEIVHQRDRARAAGNQRDYGASAGAVLQHLAPILAEPAKQLRRAVCGGRGGPGDCANPALAGCYRA